MCHTWSEFVGCEEVSSFGNCKRHEFVLLFLNVTHVCSSELLVPTVVVLVCEETCLLLGLLQGRQNEVHEGRARWAYLCVCVSLLLCFC